jgi:hypothetical protein
MDYLDPQKQLRRRIIMLLGYVLMAVAIALGTWLLVEVAQGFGRGKNGIVIQNGLTFFSSQPSSAGIYVNGASKPINTTNTRLYLPEGIYGIQLKRSGYRTWQRTVVLTGGSVEHFDYPLLFPTTMTPKPVQNYTSAPQLVTQSPDRRWLVVSQPGKMTDFDIYDLKNKDPATALTKLSLPAGLLTQAVSSENWQLEEWADDNQHLVLQHNYDGKTEFILVDRTDPAQTRNLNTTLSLSPADNLTSPIKLTLDNKKYDQYYIYDSTSVDTTPDPTLQTISLKTLTPASLLDHVLNYQTYGSNLVIYVTDSGTAAGKVQVKLLQAGKTYNIRTLPAGSTYLLDLAQYSGTPYLAVGANSDNKVYIYRDPVGQLAALKNQSAPADKADPGLVPTQVLHVTAPNYLSFSANAQFIMAEDGTEFGVYDIENKQLYHYTIPQALDTPQIHATWMDGDRLTYSSAGKLLVFDYDAANRQTLIPADGQYLPAFTPDYKNVFTFVPATTSTVASQFDLAQTSLLTPTDH